ncbi:hypothetical protein [Tenggerimyces flavus]|uniref:Uncharacterized protein n=1 Tax=Tenggerimyces flavus TaxID=1708749 RepID=A0ABV7Y7J2_9ACTN|nr:hypothetical protein [Tenggerimyces flavus]MBM7790510.1 hypothetical protein [Tenggerimyces flavus]
MTSIPADAGQPIIRAAGPPQEDETPDQLDREEPTPVSAAPVQTVEAVVPVPVEPGEPPAPVAAAKPGKRVGAFGAFFLILWLVMAALAVFVGILWAYPLAEQALSAGSVEPAPGILPGVRLTATTATIVVTGLAGVAGSVIRIIQKFAAWMGRGGVERSWVPWYFVTPFAAGLLGSFFGLAVTAGLIALDQQSSAQPRIAVLVVMGALAGLFSENVIQFLSGLVPSRGAPDER